MRKLIFKYAKAVNFLCFGPEGIELFFDRYGSVVNIFGTNLDRNPPRSNGTGKSSIPEIIVYAIFGKTIKSHKKIKKGDVVNKKIKKKMYVEVQWDNYRVVRTGKADSLRFWESSEGIWDETTEKTLGTSKATQELIEQAIGLNYETFTNIVIFNDRNDSAFLECDAQEKRTIVENLLSLEKYRQYSEIVKDLRKDLKDTIKFLMKECEQLLTDKEEAEQRVKHVKSQEAAWRANLKREIQNIIEKIKVKKAELESTDTGSALSLWQNAQDELKKITEQQQVCEDKKEKASKLLDEIKDKIDDAKQLKHKLTLEIQASEQKIKQYLEKVQEEHAFIKELQENRGTQCPRCRSIVSDANCNHAVLASHDKINALHDDIAAEKEVIRGKEQQLANQNTLVSKLNTNLKQVNEKYSEINKKLYDLIEENITYSKIPRPETNSQHLLLEQEIANLKKQGLEKKKLFEDKVTPYAEILKKAIEELETKTNKYNSKDAEIKEANELLPYYEYWMDAFGDSGIRKLVIDGVIPALNANIAYWLEPLMSGMITLEFNNELDETIRTNPPDGDPYVYAACSRGEQHMMNLSISRAFSHIMMLSWGAIPSFIFLDEVGSNMDEVAKRGVYNMICELSKDRQVFVTTHDKYLLDLLQGCTELHLEKKDGFTTLVDKFCPD